MGVDVETVRPGDGKTFPQRGRTVIVHYVGTLTCGKKFDSSRDRGEPFQFKLGAGEVIRGWDEGVARRYPNLRSGSVTEAIAVFSMSLGQVARLTCTPDFGYGSRGYPPVIPPNATLIFEVELLKC